MRRDNNYVIVVEHDLSVLDYLSEYVDTLDSASFVGAKCNHSFICVLYGRPAVYGVVTLPVRLCYIKHFFLELCEVTSEQSSVREGINIFLDGNIPSDMSPLLTIVETSKLTS